MPLRSAWSRLQEELARSEANPLLRFEDERTWALDSATVPLNIATDGVPLGMSKMRLKCRATDSSDWLVADVLLRQEPDEEEDEEEDNGDRKEDDENEEEDDGYSE